MKNFRRKAFCLLLTAALLFSALLTACSSTAGLSSSSSASSSKKSSSSKASSTAQSSSSAARKVLLLPYVYGKSLNPLLTDSLTNAQLWPLVYDCLAEPDANFNPVFRLASAVSSQGTTATVTLRSGLVFSDGSSLTSADVVATYNQVLSNASGYFYGKVANIAGVSAQGRTTVVFTLKTPDPLFANLLDIPIVKSGTGVSDIPVGSGRYVPGGSSSNLTLSWNSRWYQGGSPALTQIRLINVPDQSTLASSLEIGNIDYLQTDYGEGSYSAVNVKSQTLTLNQLCFLGVNTAHSPLNNVHFRRALFYALDRRDLVTDAFSGRASATDIPFFPGLSGVSKATPDNLSAHAEKAQSELKQSGAATGTSLTLLVNQENTARVTAANSVVTAFGKYGIAIKVVQLSMSDYASRIAQGNFDLYLGEIRLTDNMDLSPFLNQGGAANAGVPANTQTLAAYTAWRNGSGTLAQVTDAFRSEVPFIPICCRDGSVSFQSGLTGVAATENNLFFNVESWHF